MYKIKNFLLVKFSSQSFNLFKALLFLSLLSDSSYAYYSSTNALCQLIALIFSFGIPENLIIYCNSTSRYIFYKQILPYFLLVTFFASIIFLISFSPFLQPAQNLFAIFLIVFNASSINTLKYLNNLCRYNGSSKPILLADLFNITLSLLAFSLLYYFRLFSLGFSALLSITLALSLTCLIYILYEFQSIIFRNPFSIYYIKRFVCLASFKPLFLETKRSLSIYFINVLFYTSSLIVPLFSTFFVKDLNYLGLILKIFTFSNISLTLLNTLFWSVVPSFYAKLRNNKNSKGSLYFNSKILRVPPILILLLLAIASIFFLLPIHDIIPASHEDISIFLLLVLIGSSESISWHATSYLNVSSNSFRRIPYLILIVGFKIFSLFLIPYYGFISFCFSSALSSIILQSLMQIREYSSRFSKHYIQYLAFTFLSYMFFAFTIYLNTPLLIMLILFIFALMFSLLSLKCSKLLCL